MLITSSTAIEGMSLIHAVDCFFVAPHHNPFVEDRLISRSACKGQRDQVTAFYFYSEDSIEMRVRSRQAAKRSMANRVLDDDLVLDHAQALTDADDEEYLEMVSGSLAG